MVYFELQRCCQKGRYGDPFLTFVFVTTMNTSQCWVSGRQADWTYSIGREQRFLKHKHLERDSMSQAAVIYCNQNSFFQMCIQWIIHQPTHIRLHKEESRGLLISSSSSFFKENWQCLNSHIYMKI